MDESQRALRILVAGGDTLAHANADLSPLLWYHCHTVHDRGDGAYMGLAMSMCTVSCWEQPLLARCSSKDAA